MTAPPARRRLAPAARRAELIATAATLIADTGFHGFSLSRVAQASNITRAGVLHHFASKEELLTAVLQQRDDTDAAQFLPISRGAADPASARDILDRLVHLNHSRPEMVRLYTVLAAEALEPSHPAHSYFAARLSAGRAGIAALVASWHPDPDAFAVSVLAFMDGLQLNWLRDPSIDLESRWQDFADRAFDVTRRP